MAPIPASTTMAARDAVFHTSELRELILLSCDPKTLFSLRATNKFFHDSIDDSAPVTAQLLFESSDPSPSWPWRNKTWRIPDRAANDSIDGGDLNRSLPDTWRVATEEEVADRSKNPPILYRPFIYNTAAIQVKPPRRPAKRNTCAELSFLPRGRGRFDRLPHEDESLLLRSQLCQPPVTRVTVLLARVEETFSNLKNEFVVRNPAGVTVGEVVKRIRTNVLRALDPKGALQESLYIANGLWVTEEEKAQVERDKQCD